MLLNLVRPRYFIPIHGEYRQLFRHAALAHTVGAVSGEILLIEDGQPIEFTDDGAYRREPVTAGRVCVDSGSLEEIDEVVIRDRKHLVRGRRRRAHHRHRQAHRANRIAAGNRHARLHAVRQRPRIAAAARAVVLRTVEQSNAEEKTDWSVIKEKIRVDLRRYLKKQTSKRPLILPVILEV